MWPHEIIEPCHVDFPQSLRQPVALLSRGGKFAFELATFSAALIALPIPLWGCGCGLIEC
jgi:hypothetical protein